MRHGVQFFSTAARWIALSLAPTLFLELVRWGGGETPTGAGFSTRWGLVLTILIVSHLASAGRAGVRAGAWPAVAIGATVAALVMGGVYTLSQATWAAWALVGLVYVLLLVLERLLAGGQRRLRRLVWRALLTVVAGGLPVALFQIESSFANEEFFVMPQAVALAIFWLLLLFASRLLSRQAGHPDERRTEPVRRLVAVSLVLFILAGSATGLRAYQQSFYPSSAPSYPNISEEQPILCGEATPSAQTYDGEEIFWRLLARVEENPHKESPEYGMLALATGEQKWADAFRRSLLEEIAQGRFVSPANSVKWIQHEAAFRAYYYPRVRDRFPGLFAENERKQAQEWFAAINKRALTTEWVDLMYAVAFNKWPEGLYENQENGAGLLALLEVEGLADPALSPQNRDYLARNHRGWAARFRVTDDAIFYQPEWIYNAYFQSLYTGEGPSPNMRLSFEWLWAQSLPDGSPLQYNLSESTSLAGIAYVGAYWLDDPHLLWLAGRAVEDLEQSGRFLSAQPGLEEPVSFEGTSSSGGSCLLYGDSGLPNQAGPLAPDKLVFRDGWASDSAYLLVNLRFSGWHRYKATNTVTLLYQDDPVMIDVLHGEPATWLPVGRSAFRDKRIPRENLNGLVVERTGMSAVLYTLTGAGGKWAQDPPYYGEVVSFEAGPEKDSAHIRTSDWRGWEHDRWIQFYHSGGPIVIVDAAKGPVGSDAALMWHFAEGKSLDMHHFLVGGGNKTQEAILIPMGDGGQIEVTREEKEADRRLDVVYGGAVQGELQLVTVLLQKDWVGAKIESDTPGEIRITGTGREIILALPAEGVSSTGGDG